jgi:succinylglutamate desuccinylase
LPSDAADGHVSAEVLREASRGVPSIIEVLYRHAINDQDRFEMLPGFNNFVPVEKDQVVAHDRNGPVHAPESGLMLLPLYQGKGEDGFFIARPVRMFWLRLSALLRRLRIGTFLPWLPGVHRNGDQGLELTIDTRIARWYPLEVFHLLGYRKRRQVGNTLVVTRRAFDSDEPETLRL